MEAELLVRDGDLPAASAAYDRALSIENTSRYAARAYQIRSQAGLASPLEPLTNFLQERPFDTSFRMYLAQAYQRLEQESNANAEYGRVLEYEPNNFVAANNLAWGYFRIGDPRAEEVARQAFAIQPTNSSVADTLGWILVRKGELKDGIAMLRNAIGLGGRGGEIRYHLAAALAEAGETVEARELLTDVLSSDANFSSRADAERLLETL